MKQLLKQIAITSLDGVNAFPTSVSEKVEVASLIQKLHPRKTKSELIRLGPAGDGGYLLPDDLNGIEACFSPGVDQSSDFELDCAQRGMEIFMADASVAGPAAEHERFHFLKKFVGASNSEEFMTLDDWVSQALPDSKESDLLLQMDIEGFEYEALLNISNRLLERFRIILVEFHSLDLLWSAPLFKLTSRVFEKLLQTHSCVHIHPNNVRGVLAKGQLEIPGVMEFTFVRSDRVQVDQLATQFPHPLDADNMPTAPLVLPACWYGGKVD